MHSFSLSAIAGVFLAGLVLVPEASLAQTAARPPATARPTRGKPRAAKKPVRSAASQPVTTAAPAAAAVSVSPPVSASSKRAARAVRLPDNDYFTAGRQRIAEARAQDSLGTSSEENKALFLSGQAVDYDAHHSSPKRTVLGNLMPWRDHLVLQLALRDAGLNAMLEKEEMTLLAPTDAVLLLLAPDGRLPHALLRSYIIPGTHRLTEVAEGVVEPFKALDGTGLLVERKGNHLWLTTPDQHRLKVTVSDVPCANGLISILEPAGDAK